MTALAAGLVSRGHAVSVAVFYGGGVFEAELRTAGVRLIVLDKRGRWDLLPFFFRLLHILRRERPAVLHSYLTVPNLLAALCKPFLPGTRIVWGLRASNMDLQRYDWLARLTAWLEARFSRLADRVIANSQAGKLHAVGAGFREKSIEVVHNGIDTEHFCFDYEGRRQIRSAWGVDKDEILVGLVARLDPMKDHLTFLEAASRIAYERHDVRFVCVGDGPAAYAETLKQQAAALGLTSRLIWAGARDDMPAVYSALDIASSSSSFGEGFSNTIAEAMACGVPTVVTDVGDSAWIVGGAGVVVPHSDPDALTQGILNLMAMPAEQRRALGGQARSRIVAEFGIDNLVQATERALGNLEISIRKC